MTKKIKTLLAVNIGLIAGIALTFALGGKTSGTLADQAVSFALADTSGIDRISLGKRELTKTAAGWLLDGKTPADEENVKVLLALMQRLKIQRPVSADKIAAVQSKLQKEGIAVAVYAGDELRSKMTVGRQAGQGTYTALEGQEPYFVHIPGYDIDFYEFVEVKNETWRDRTLFATSWRTLKKLEARYAAKPENDLLISFDSSFYKVEGVAALDSAKLYDYINSLESVKGEAYLDNLPNLRADLAKTKPFCSFAVQDLYAERGNLIHIYETASGWVALSTRTDEFMALDEKYFMGILRPKPFFERKVLK